MDGPVLDGASARTDADEAARCERRDVLVTTRRTWLLLVALALYLPAVAAMVAGTFHVRLPPTWSFAPGVLMMCAAAIFLGYFRAARRMRGDVVCDDRGVVLGGVMVRRRSSLRSGFLRKLPDGTFAVRLIGRYLLDPLDVHVRDEQQGEAMLRALKLDRAHSTALFAAMEGGMRGALRRALEYVACVLLGASALVSAVLLRATPAVLGDIAVGTVIICIVGIARVLRANMRIVVGSDGLLMKRTLGGGARYLPYAELGSAAVDGNDVVLRLRSGREMRLGLGLKRFLGREHAGDALARRIEDARSAPAAQGTAQHTALVARGDRTVSEWLAALGKLADAARASYREATLPRAQLWRIVEDIASPPGARAGAAVVLRAQLEEGERARLRVAAQACASTDLRRALEATARGDDDAALEHAMELLEEKAR
jgi:hypothetical protein